MFAGWIVSALTDWNTGPRIALDFAFLVISNCGLIYLRQMAGQFGVVGSDADVLADDKSDDCDVEADNSKTKKHYTPPEVELNGYNEVENSNASPEDGENNNEVDVASAPLVAYLFVISGVTEDPDVVTSLVEEKSFPRLQQLKGVSMSENSKRQGKILLTFIFVTMFWSVIWDLFGSLPREELTVVDDDNGA